MRDTVARMLELESIGHAYGEPTGLTDYVVANYLGKKTHMGTDAVNSIMIRVGGLISSIDGREENWKDFVANYGNDEKLLNLVEKTIHRADKIRMS